MDALQRQEILSEIAGNVHEETDSRIRAIDTLNKMTGEYTQKVSLDGDKGVVIIDDIKRSAD